MNCSSTGRTGVAPVARAALPCVARSWVTIFGLLMVVAIRGSCPHGKLSSPLAAARGSIPLIQRGSCLFAFDVVFIGAGALCVAGLCQRFVDQPRDFDAFFDPFVLYELDARREASLEPASKL